MKAKGKAANSTPSTPATNGKSSARVKKPITYDPVEDDDDFPDDDLDGADDLFAEDFKKNGKIRGDDYVEDEDDDEVVLPHRISPKKRDQKKLVKEKDDFVPDAEDVDMKDVDPDDDFLDPDNDERILVDKPAKGNTKKPATSRKRKSVELEEDEEDNPPKKGRGRPPKDTKKSPAKKRAKKEEVAESSAVQAIYDSIPLVRPPTPPPQSDAPAKFNWRAGGAANHAPPPMAGAGEIPTGAENCLAGLTFVFTGVGQILGREEGQNLVKRYGGKLTTAPSKKTSYVVLGSDAGPRKLEKIRENNIKTIDENGLFELIRRLPANGGDGKAAAAYEQKQQEEIKKIKEMAAEMDKEERRVGGVGGAGGGKAAMSSGKTNEPAVDNRLWTVK